MGLNVDRASFEAAEYEAFAEKLRASLRALRELLRRPGFGEGPLSLGAELELFLIDEGAHPLPLNREVLARSFHDQLSVELNRCNLELGFRPQAFRGKPFTAVAREMNEGLAEARRAAGELHGRVVTIGILPTLTSAHLGSEGLTRLKRYQALSAGAKRLRQAPFHLEIAGEDKLVFDCNDVAAEGANTSLQMHLRVPPARFAAVYNAAQIATAPALAVAGNSPLFLGHRLWEETRIALFNQSIDDRKDHEAGWRPARVSFGHGWVREGAWELFAESVALHPPLIPMLTDEEPERCVRRGGVPELKELRLHHGTTWHWNRAVYDPTQGGHLRVEFRALPAGPTVTDMMANAAFLLGLTLSLSENIDDILPRLTFGQARRNFYEAARHGLNAELLWPESAGPSPRAYTASDLLPALVDRARDGLVANGIDRSEAGEVLSVIRARAESGQTGARWLRKRFAEEPDPARLVEAYLRESASGRPVHAWPKR